LGKRHRLPFRLNGQDKGGAVLQSRWIAWGLALVVLLQVWSLMKLDDVQHLHSQLTALGSQMRNLEQRVSNLNHELGTMAKAAEWVIDPRVKVENDPGCKAVTAVVDWSLKEAAPNAQVELLYRRRGEAQWQVVSAASTGTGSYQASFTMAAIVQGHTVIEVNQPGGGRTETAAADSGGATYEYRIATQSAAGSRSSDPRPLQLTPALTAFFRIAVTVHDGGRYEIHLDNRQKGGETPCTAITGASVKGLAGAQTVVESTLAPTTVPTPGFRIDLHPGQSLDRVEVTVRYVSGIEEVHLISIR
jgi:hypothetical protein